MTNRTIKTTKNKRFFVDEDFKLDKWEDIAKYYTRLSEKTIENIEDFLVFLQNRSELESIISEDFAWRYIKMTCDTNNEIHKADFDFFIQNIQPQIAPFDDILNKKIMQSDFKTQVSEENTDWKGLGIALKGMQASIDVFKEQNIPLFVQIQQLSSQYQSLNGSMSVEIDGETKTLQQAGVWLENPDRAKRESVYRTIQERRQLDTVQIDAIFDQLVELRHQVATNAGFDDYVQYSFKAMRRFDYTEEDCADFHNAVQKTIIPILNQLADKRKEKLNIDTLKPWDKNVDISQKPTLKPFENATDLLEKTILCFDKIDPFLGDCMKEMKARKRLDLESRLGKAPGGYNYPLEETGFPFIFMNASSLMRDVITMIHEGGHAVHSILTKDLKINSFRNFPSEVAELASMSMELISMEHWEVFFENTDELNRAKIQHLEDILATLPWVATVDKFQHWIYKNPNHSQTERNNAWLNIFESLSDNVTDWNDLQHFKQSLWHKQLHIFELPFYYIEYGIAQLGAIAVWKNYKENKEKGLEAYLSALSLGYKKSINEIYSEANISFDFSETNIKNLITFVQNEIQTINSTINA